MHDAKTNLSRLVKEVLAGEEIVIANDGSPVARLVPFRDSDVRVPGAWRDQVWMAPDFDEPDEGDIHLWYRSLPEPR